jgi:hypothetical protein
MFCVAQQLPVGTMLPVVLSTAINADKAKVGERISGKLGQYVTVDGMRLPRGTEVQGRILRVEPGAGSSPSKVALAFETIRVGGRDVPITTSLRAMASMQSIFEAQLPTNVVDDYGSSIGDWNTLQVGGQSVYRGNGTVMEGAEVVGKASIVGEVFGEPKTWPWLACARDRTSKTLQSFWVFSTDACGVYGFDGLKLTHAGRSDPVGQIVLESPGKLRVRAGSGILLMVLSSSQAEGEASSDSRHATLSGSIESATQR